MRRRDWLAGAGALVLVACGGDGEASPPDGGRDSGPLPVDAGVDASAPRDAEVGDGSTPPTDAGADDGGGAPDSLPAFPGAEGFGASVSGGRGGRVIHVTSLAAGGPGSLQEAIDASGPRTIVFDVGGYIPDVIVAETGDFTIAGQTAPGGVSIGGLMLQGDVVCEGDAASGCPNPSRHPANFVVRHVRIRTLNDDGDGGGDGLRFHHAVRGIVDHVSIGNAADEAVQMSFSRAITLQHTILGETIGSHGRYGGMLINYSDVARGFPQTDLSIHHNLWVRIAGRYPEINRENVLDTEPARLEMSNNVLWGTRAPLYITSVAPGFETPLPWLLNLVGNFAADDPSDAFTFGFLAIEPPPDLLAGSAMFLSDTVMRGVTARDWALVYNNNDFADALATDGTPWAAAPPPWARSERHPFPPITYTPSGDALLDATARAVGAFPRDRFDQRMTGYVRDRVIDGREMVLNADGDLVVGNPAGDLFGAPMTASTLPDTDGDGMPDAWESARGLDPADPADGNRTSLSRVETGVEGYTNLESYLHWLSEERIAGR
jgi:hypothetical protein